MVLLVAKINKLYSKLENLHHHNHPSQSSEAVLAASLEGFFSEIFSNGLLSKLISSSSSSSEAVSFSWIHHCFELIPIANKAFAKLVVAIDHPVSKWTSDSLEEHLSYSLNLLELFNSISSSLSLLAQARVSLSHALCLKEDKSHTLALRHLKAVEPLGYLASKGLVVRKEKGIEEAKGSCSSKEEVIHKAILAMESLGFWVCGVVLSSLNGGDPKPYAEMRRYFGGGFALHSSFARLDSSVSEAMVAPTKEVKDVNDSVACLVAAMRDGKSSGDGEAEELRRRLEVFERALDGLGTEVDRLFKEVLRGRNQLVSGFQGQQIKE